ncbi:hypothetical protein PSV09DRAFT_2380397 [Bipolaris maydis]|nr:hypothetical protein J3E74DRAFT_479379 [Bipolaris maydis]KAJ5057379.1 hypothetical protein J3E74DRAFT_477349 [Bipolaris maydis]KAJ6212874.1 hypothetical protein PSV09DRAFT_2380397 [Bipolaris maydis]
MYCPLASDQREQDQDYPDERTLRPSKSRISKACNRCRDQRTWKKVSSFADLLEASGRNRSYTHSTLLEPRRKDSSKAFSSENIRQLFNVYIDNVHILYPIFDKPWAVCAQFEDHMSHTAERSHFVEPSFENAHALLFLALGSCFSDSNNTKESDTIPGSVYYDWAQYILKCRCGDRSIAYAQALTLAALYNNQNAMLGESLASLCLAQSIYEDIVKSLIAKDHLSEEVKRSVRIFQILASSVHDCPSIIPSLSYLHDWTALKPGKKMEDVPNDVLWTKIMLGTVLEAAKRYPRLPDFASIKKFDDELLFDFARCAEFKIKIMEAWRSTIMPHLAWNDQDLPSTDPLMASLRAEYYEGVATLLRPYLEVLKYLNRIDVSVNETSKGQRGILHTLHNWKRYALSNIVAFDRIRSVDGTYKAFRSTSNGPVVMGNPVNTLHSYVDYPVTQNTCLKLIVHREFKTVFLIQAIDSTSLGAHIRNLMLLSKEDMDYLYYRTVDRLSKFRPRIGLLIQDIQLLCMPWQHMDPFLRLDLAATLAV